MGGPYTNFWYYTMAEVISIFNAIVTHDGEVVVHNGEVVLWGF